jgi:hypothetical protein
MSTAIRAGRLGAWYDVVSRFGLSDFGTVHNLFVKSKSLDTASPISERRQPVSTAFLI